MLATLFRVRSDVVDAQRSALMVIDMLNPYEHEDADQLTPSVERSVGNIRDLIARAHDEGVRSWSRRRAVERGQTSSSRSAPTTRRPS